MMTMVMEEEPLAFHLVKEEAMGSGRELLLGRMIASSVDVLDTAHWAMDGSSGGGGPSRGGGWFTPHSRFGGPGRGSARFGDHDRFVSDRYDGGRFGEIDRHESSDSKYGGGYDRYAGDRYAEGGDRYGGDRYGVSDRYAPGGYGKEREYERGMPPPSRGIRGRYGGGGPACDEGRSYGSRSGPYNRPSRVGSGYDRPSSGVGRPQYYR